MRFSCSTCGETYPLDGLDFHCRCGGLFRLDRQAGEAVGASVSLGEVPTPVLERTLNHLPVRLKLDFMRPTGSFKDRGAFVLVNALKDLGIDHVVEDSSGNAGAAIAGYCAAAGIRCDIYIPQGTSPGKIKQLAAYQAHVVQVPGSRDDTAQAILEAARTTYYASHVYNPLFFEGTKSMAHELAGQGGIPDCIVIPAGNGTMLLGAYIGFSELGRLPRIIAVQSSRCAPVHARFHGLEAQAPAPTVAEGIAIGRPMRMAEMLAAVRDSGGDCITVTDEAVLAAQRMLGAMGIYVEATAAVAVAGALEYFPGASGAGLDIVVPLTGSGLKK
jgi:threonine synthase